MQLWNSAPETDFFTKYGVLSTTTFSKKKRSLHQMDTQPTFVSKIDVRTPPSIVRDCDSIVRECTIQRHPWIKQQFYFLFQLYRLSETWSQCIPPSLPPSLLSVPTVISMAVSLEQGNKHCYSLSLSLSPSLPSFDRQQHERHIGLKIVEIINSDKREAWTTTFNHN